jgi:hypothetical protein
MSDDLTSRVEKPVPATDFTKKEEIQILLAEYVATRQELFSRYTALVSLISIGSASFLAIIGVMLTKSPLAGLFLLPILAVILWYGLNIIDFDTRAAADHLETLEARINGVAEKRLLTWESDHGLRARPMAQRLRQRLRENVGTVFQVSRALSEKARAKLPTWIQGLLSQGDDRPDRDM